MKKIIKELEIIINKDLYQESIINFEEFKTMNELLLKEKDNEYIKNQN